MAEDLHCIRLLPAAGIPRVEAHVELLPPASPFGASVTPTGAARQELILEVAGLPDPSSLGPYEAFVAWATTPRLRPMLRLGTIREGRQRLGTVGFNRFLILVTAEEDPETEHRSGRLVLRGGSPSLRLHPHDYAAFLGTAAGGRGDGGDTRAWTIHPQPPPAVQPMPGLRDLQPSVDPFLPDVDPNAVREATPTRLVDVGDGDTLRLEAGPVRLRLGTAEFVAYGFNGQIPGPSIRVEQDTEITVLFQNNLELPTTVHWHGIRVENRFDGVPGVTQDPVEPGGRFVYRVRFPDAGIYWYHPHVREDIQQDLGLSGNIRVEPTEEGWYNPVNREELLMLDDVLMSGGRPVPWGLGAATHAMMGRFGNTLLVNGRPEWRLDVRPREVMRLFLTNAANTRVFHLVLEGADMKAVASDLGRFPVEMPVEGVVLAPAERAVVELLYPEPGRYVLTNRIQGVDHLRGVFYSQVDTLGVIRVGGQPVSGDEDHTASFRRLRVLPGLRDELSSLEGWRARTPDHRLVLTMEAEDLPFPLGPIMQGDSLWFPPVEWSGSMAMSNWVTTTREVRWILRDADTGRENMDIGWEFSRGDTVKLKLINDRHAFHAMQHPIHLHGQRFLVMKRDGVPDENPAWKDTVLVPTGSTVELLVEFSNPGRWMLHCHIAEHLESGMRTVMTVHESDRPKLSGSSRHREASTTLPAASVSKGERR